MKKKKKKAVFFRTDIFETFSTDGVIQSLKRFASSVEFLRLIEKEARTKVESSRITPLGEVISEISFHLSFVLTTANTVSKVEALGCINSCVSDSFQDHRARVQFLVTPYIEIPLGWHNVNCVEGKRMTVTKKLPSKVTQEPQSC